LIIEVTPVNEHMMRQRYHHSFGVVSLVFVYALTEAGDLNVKDALYATLWSVVDQCSRRDNLVVVGDFNALTRTDSDGHKTYVGSHGSGTVNEKSTKFLDFA